MLIQPNWIFILFQKQFNNIEKAEEAYRKKYDELAVVLSDQGLEEIKPLCDNYRQSVMDGLKMGEKILSRCMKRAQKATSLVLKFSEKSFDFMCNLKPEYYKGRFKWNF